VSYVTELQEQANQTRLAKSAVPLFTVTSHTPISECAHRGRIRKGSSFVCVRCFQYGKDHLVKAGTPGDAARESARRERELEALTQQELAKLRPDPIQPDGPAKFRPKSKRSKT
jgi:hypothetical protein